MRKLMFRTMHVVAGTLVAAVAGLGLWVAQRPSAETPRSTPLLTPQEAAAQVALPGPVITPGAVVSPRETASRSKNVVPVAKPGRNDDESWQVIYLDDQRIGWSRVHQKDVQINGRPAIRTTTELTMQFKRFGQDFSMQKSLVTEETLTGELLSFTTEMNNPPATPTKTTAIVDGQTLRVESTINGRIQSTRIAWDPEVRSAAWQDRLLREPPLKPGDKREFKSFFPDFNKIATVRITADEKQQVKLLDGKHHSLLKVRMSNSLAPDLTTRSFLDEKGDTLRSEDDLLGKTMVTFTVSQEEALKKLTGSDLDLAVSTLVPTDAVRDGHGSQKQAYRITLTDDDPSKHFLPSETQSVKKLADDSIELTVVAPTQPRERKAADVAEEFKNASQYLQSNDGLVREHARKASAGANDDDLKAAMQMEQYVHRNLTRKNFSTALASAAEVAASLEGDCTEHAVFLAAMLRAREIPSRVVVGLVYVDGVQAFGAHMWTEAWIDGHWRPLDATLGRGSIGAAHIRIADSSLSDDGPSPVATFLPLLRILGKARIEVLPAK